MMTNTFLWFLLIFLILLPVVLYDIQKSNLKYFKENGRDPNEIAYWLKNKNWFPIFKNRILDEILYDKYGLVNDEDEIDSDKINIEEIKNEIDERISGIFDTNTISNAFCWKNTPEGTKYWGKKEYEFLMWYFGQYVDFHLFK